MKKAYFKFLVKMLLFVVVFLLIDKLIGVSFNYLSNKSFEKNELSRSNNYLYCIKKADSNNAEIAIIGSSTGSHHYIPKRIEDSLGLSVYNFAYDGCFFLYQNTLINLMLERYAPKVILWEIGESCLSNSHDNKEYQSMDDFYPYYSNSYVKEVINHKDNYQPIRMKLSSYIWNSRLFRLLQLCMVKSPDENKGYIPSDKKKFVNIKEKDYNYHIVQEKVDRLTQTINRCKKNGTQIIFTSSPRFYSGAVLNTDSYYKLVDIAENNDIPIINFYNVEPFCNDSTLFNDNSHLNYVGAELYMDMFIPVLDSILLNKKIIN